YPAVTALAGGIPVFIPTGKNNFKLTARELESHCDKKTKAIILNYPVNPTGVSYTKKELEAIKAAALRHNLTVVADEVYDELTYDFDHIPFASLSGARKNTLYLNGFSKAYAMTGWRVGYVCGTPEVIAAMTKIHQYTIMCVSITAQMAACEALVSGRSAVMQMKREYLRRREFVMAGLKEIGLECVNAQGAFYAFASIKSTSLSSMDFCQRLLKEQKVAVVPGTAFGKSGEGYIRISYASSLDNLKEALRRIEVFLGRFKGKARTDE
ncbi:aminotransferase class I/II-fold pyridoxal phosphate-dependent enzyme, partial [bacterium]